MWFDYRNTIFHYDTLANNISNQYNFLLTNKIYERESIVYDNYPFSQEDLTYTLEWLSNRLNFLDDYFNSVLTIDENKQNNKRLFIYPNPSDGKIYIKNVASLTDKKYKIYNLSGQIMQEGIMTNNYIELPNLAKGIYIIELNNQKNKFSIK